MEPDERDALRELGPVPNRQAPGYFNIPSKEGNPVCIECRTVDADKHLWCDEPCSHLISWAIHQRRVEVTKAVIALENEGHGRAKPS